MRRWPAPVTIKNTRYYPTVTYTINGTAKTVTLSSEAPTAEITGKDQGDYNIQITKVEYNK